MSKTFRIAVVGLGVIGMRHAQAIRELPNATLVGGVEPVAERGRKFAEQFSCPWYVDCLEMIEKTRPDVVTVCTPSGGHLEVTELCARQGVHVLCEKPMEITTARIDRMIAAAARAGVALGGIYPQRYGAATQAVRAAAAAGRFGSLAVVNTYTPWWREDAYYAPDRWQGKLRWDGGGALMNQSIHGIDAMQWIAAAAMPDLPARSNPVAEVFAFTAKRSHDPDILEVEDTAVASVRFHNGALGQILGCTGMWPGMSQRLQVAGRDGSAEVLEDDLTAFKFRTELPTDEATRKSLGGGASRPPAVVYARHKANIADFLRAVEDKESPPIDGAEARKAVAIIEAIYQSAASGKPVPVQ